MIKNEPEKSYKIMGADVKQSAKEFEDSAKYLRWADRAENKKFFTKEFEDFSNTAAGLLLQMGLIKNKPDVSSLYTTSAIAD
jgi:NitT/TauT family transport system substrate-binding protein